MINKKTSFYDDAGFEFTFEPIEDTIIREHMAEGYRVKYLCYDTDYESPDKWGDDSIFLVFYHRDCNIESDYVSKSDVSLALQGNPDNEEHIAELLNKYHILPVSAYIHSGVSLSLKKSFAWDSGGWDTSHSGALFVKKREFGAGGVEFEKTLNDAFAEGESLIESWSQYLSGDVYCCVVESYDKDKEQIDYDVVGGFYGRENAEESLKTEF